jgi:hypothetical protein
MAQPKPLPKVNKGAPIKVTELIKRRHEKAVRDLQRTIEQREAAYGKLGRLTSKIWKLGKQVQYYEKTLGL